MIKITKEEMNYLHNELEHPVPLGDGGIIHTTARHRRSYWLTESRKNLKLLSEYRDKICNIQNG